MRLTWTQRLAVQPEYRDINAWPFIDSHTLPAAKRVLFLRNQRIAAQALAGQRSADIAAMHGIHRTLVSHLMQRCLGGDDAADPALTQGLIPNVPLQHNGRRTPWSSLQQRAGARGAFSALLEQLPSVRAGLDAIIRPAVQRRAESENVMPKGLEQAFIRLLREAQWPADHYPFTEKSRGYESLRQYWHRRSDELRMPKKKNTRVIRSATTHITAYEEIQIDEQTFDAQGRIDLELDQQHISLRLGRIALICAVDKDTDSWLAYHVCLTSHPTQFDLLSLLQKVHAPWEAMTLSTPGLTYLPGACLPSALGSPFIHAGIGIARFDNALCHTAHTVRNYVCCDLGATYALGLAAHPKARNVVEHAFDLVSDQARRFASTTGSHPLDPVREARKHRNNPPRVTLRALEEAISVILTGHNVTPQARLGDRSPLDILQHQMHNGWLRLLPADCVRRLNPFMQRRVVPIHWLKHENRRPHVNFEYVRYVGDCLCDIALLKAPITIEFDTRNIRFLKAYDAAGRYLGDLHAPLSWQRYPHSIVTRGYIHKLTKVHRLDMNDPLGGYFAYLLAHRELPRDALEMLRVYREFQVPQGITLTPPPPNSFSASTLQSPFSVPAWSPSLARRRRHDE